jgi:hypothetical protein
MSGVIGNPGQQYDALSVVADLTVAATAANPFKLRPQILPGAGFDPTAGYFWPVASADKVSFPAGSVAIDRSLVLAPGVFSVAPVGKNLVLRYEPATSHSEWNVDGGGDWPVSSNWIGGVPDWPTTSVGFGPVLQSQSAGHILLNGRRFASSVNFNSSNSYVIDPGNDPGASLALGSAEAPASITVAGGNHSITAGLEMGSHLPVSIATNSSLLLGPITNTGGRTILKSGQGTLTIGGTQAHGVGATLDLREGAVFLNANTGTPASATSGSVGNLKIQISGSGSRVVLGADQEIASISITTSDAGTQSFDLASPSAPGAFRYVRVFASDLTAAKASLWGLIRNAITNSGDGIYDSGLASHPNSALGLALLYDRYNKPHIMIRPTRVGDANLDGQVTIADFINLSSNFNKAGTWQEGDLNGDGMVTISDFIDLSSNFGSSYAGDVSPISAADDQLLTAFATEHGISVPEPAGFPLVVVGSLVLAYIRRVKPR